MLVTAQCIVVTSGADQDPGDVVDIATWSIAELGSAITLCSVPAIRPLISHYFPAVMGSMVKSRGTAGASQTPSSSQKSRNVTDTETAFESTEPRWSSHTELDNFDNSLRKKRSEDMESQERILQPA